MKHALIAWPVPYFGKCFTNASHFSVNRFLFFQDNVAVSGGQLMHVRYTKCTRLPVKGFRTHIV